MAPATPTMGYASITPVYSYAVVSTVPSPIAVETVSNTATIVVNLPAEAKLTEIMTAATKTEDVMAVFNQLTQVRLQVEQLKGQIQYFDESAAMSAISMDLIPDALNQPITVGGWQPQGVAKDALESLVRAFQGLATGAIWIGLYLLPLALIIGQS